MQCPINDLKILPKEEAVGNENAVPFGPNLTITYSNTGSVLPTTGIHLDIEQPCIEYTYHSGLANSDNSIYQTFEPEYIRFADLLPPMKNRCPLQNSTKLYFDPRYTLASSNETFDLNLKEIKVENGVYRAIRDNPLFDQVAFEKNAEVTPKLWTKNANFYSLTCDQSDELSLIVQVGEIQKNL